MAHFFALGPVHFEPMHLVTKAGSALRTQLTGGSLGSLLSFSLVFNAMLCLFVVRAIARRFAWNRLWSVAAVVSVQFIATIVLFQNQARYQLPVLGVLLMTVADVPGTKCRTWPLKAAPTAAFSLILVIAGTGWFFGGIVRKEGENEGLWRRAIADGVNAYAPPLEAIAIDTSSCGQYLAAGFALRPRPILYIRDGYNHTEIRELLRSARTGWLVTSEASAAITAVGIEVDRGAILPPPVKGLRLFRLKEGTKGTGGRIEAWLPGQVGEEVTVGRAVTPAS